MYAGTTTNTPIPEDDELDLTFLVYIGLAFIVLMIVAIILVCSRGSRICFNGGHEKNDENQDHTCSSIELEMYK